MGELFLRVSASSSSSSFELGSLKTNFCVLISVMKKTQQIANYLFSSLISQQQQKLADYGTPFAHP